MEALTGASAACLTIYDAKLGDKENNIKEGTPFEELPEHYCCAVCGSSKENYTKERLQLVSE